MPLPILMYHEMGARDRYSLAENEFAWQMAQLAEKGYSTLALADLSGDISALSKRIMVTFDDGYLTDYTTAYLILNKYEFKAVCFLTTSFIGTDQYMSWEQVKELQQKGWDMQSHTHTHPLLATLQIQKVKEELTISKDILEQKLGREVQALSLPGGSLNKAIVATAGECGYKYLFTSIPKLNNTGGPGVYNRFLVKSGLAPADFDKVVAGDRVFYRKSRTLYEMKKLAKNIIGSERYLKTWRKYYKENK